MVNATFDFNHLICSSVSWINFSFLLLLSVVYVFLYGTDVQDRRWSLCPAVNTDSLAQKVNLMDTNYTLEISVVCVIQQ